MQTAQLIESLAFRFTGAGIDNAKRTAEELLAHVCGCKPLEIYTRWGNRTSTQREEVDLVRRLEPLAVRIEQGEPLQYVIGHVDFWGLNIRCDRRALIPRPETELLVEEVLSAPLWKQAPATIIDVGTGSGCIALTLAAKRPDARVKAIDVSADALALARENALRLGLDGRIEWIHGSLLEGLGPQSCDGIIANLPYISSEDWSRLPASVRDHEPRLALESRPGGMELIRELAAQARTVLRPGGFIFLEFGFDQGERVRTCLEADGFEHIKILHDLAGHERIASARR
jgi:release factor glutamine methyltransferase